MDIDFPPEMFLREFAAPKDWPDEPDVRRTVDWFRSYMNGSEWTERRNQAAGRLYLAAQGNRPELGEQGRFYDPKDTFAWYLFLAESFLDHPRNYEHCFGSRVLPIFQAIGRHVNALRKVPGVDERVRQMITSGRSQPNGTLFELLVAGAYLRERYGVAMVPEQPGQQRTHDLDASRAGVSWAIECKRIETGEYAERERERMRQLWCPIAQCLEQESLSVLCNVDFLVPVMRVPDDYFFSIWQRWAGAAQPHTWSDAISSGMIGRLDLGPLSAVLATDLVVSPGTRLLELLTGSCVPAGKYITSIKATSAEHPRYMASCEIAIVLQWESSSSEAHFEKARSGLKLISKAINQLPDRRHCVVHVGFEAVNGDAVEKARLERFQHDMQGFDPKGKQLAYVYAHCLVPESPPNKAWLFRETGSWHAISPTFPRPLESPMLVLPADEPDLDGGHWQNRED